MKAGENTHVVTVGSVTSTVTDDVEALESEGVVGGLGNVRRDNVVVGDDTLGGLAGVEGVEEAGSVGVEDASGSVVLCKRFGQ